MLDVDIGEVLPLLLVQDLQPADDTVRASSIIIVIVIISIIINKNIIIIIIIIITTTTIIIIIDVHAPGCGDERGGGGPWRPRAHECDPAGAYDHG
jgi:hypothetical protein